MKTKFMLLACPEVRWFVRRTGHMINYQNRNDGGERRKEIIIQNLMHQLLIIQLFSRRKHRRLKAFQVHHKSVLLFLLARKKIVINASS